LKTKTLGNIPIPKGVKVVEIATTTGEKLRFPTFETAKLGDVTKMMMKSGEKLEMLNNGSKAGKKVLAEVAEDGLSEKAKSGMKRLKYELPKELMAKAKEQLVTLNVARTELIARLDDLAKSSNLLADTKVFLSKAKNSIKDHLTQDDLVGALRDIFGKEVKQSGTGYIYDHLGEVQDAIKSIKRANQQLLKELNKTTKGSDEYIKLSKEIDALKEMKRRVELFLEIK
jgi:Bacterial toxin 28